MKYKVNPIVLDKIRSDKDLNSDEQLADELGLGLATISNIRRGKSPAFTTVMKLMTAANITDIRAVIRPA